MSGPANELAAVAFFVVVGWAALWPSRHRLGVWAYHGAALPTGLMSAVFAGSLAAFLRRPLDVAITAAGALLLVAVLWFVQRLAAQEIPAPAGEVGARSFLIAGGVLGGLASFFALARYTVSNNDSFMSYWPLGVSLNRTGSFTVSLISSRGPFLPAMNAIHVAFGSDWAYVIYSMLGATLLYWCALSLLSGPLSTLATKTARLVAGGAVLFLVLEPSFLFHSFFVHSHMISAVCLLMSLTSIWLAVRPTAPSAGPPSNAFLILAGVFAAGFALARPDGLAYQFVPVVAAISAMTLSQVRWRSVVAFFAPLLVLEGLAYAAAYWQLGMWKAGKLGGEMTAAILAVLALSAAGPWIVEWLDRRLPLRVGGERFFGIVTATAAGLMLAAFVWQWDKASLVLAHVRINLFEGAGGYFHLWYAIAIVLVLSLFTGDALRAHSWTRPAFLSMVLFLAIAGLVHGTQHPGRIGPGDSLNRVLFHLVPLFAWYTAAVVARVLGGQPQAEQPGTAEQA